MIIYMQAYLLILVTIIKVAFSAPNCTYHGLKGSDLICTSTDEDNYILKRGLVSDSNKTRSITLRGCRISEVKKESFQNLFYLQSLDLSDNSIPELKLGVLDGSRNVKNLNLSLNLIETLPLGIFDSKPEIVTLDLSSNRLVELKLGIFDALRKLKHLDISNNALEGININPYLFDRSKNINFIDFSKNDMNDAPENLLHAFSALQTLNLNECFLSEVPSFISRRNLKTLNSLSLARNQIVALENITVFVNLENLERLDLSENMIEVVQEEVFAPLRKLTVLKLRRNKLTHLSDKMFQSMKLLGNLDLSHNRIAEVPVNAFRGTALKNLNLSVNRFTFLIDNFCLELRNSGVRLTKFYFNQNPWQCACMRDILREVKSLEIDYNSALYDGKRPTCVTTEEYTCKRHVEFNHIYTELYDNLGKTK